MVCGPIATTSLSSIGPVSSPGSIKHDRDAGLGVALQDRGAGSAPAPRQRGSSEAWDVDTAQPRRVEHRARQDQAVGGDHSGVEVELGERPAVGPRPSAWPGCAPAGRARRPRSCTGRPPRLPAAAGGARRLGIDGRDLGCPRLDQGNERRHGEVGGAHEGEAQAGHGGDPESGDGIVMSPGRAGGGRGAQPRDAADGATAGRIGARGRGSRKRAVGGRRRRRGLRPLPPPGPACGRTAPHLAMGGGHRRGPACAGRPVIFAMAKKTGLMPPCRVSTWPACA